MEAGEDPRPIIERGVGVVALGSGLFLAPLAACAPALIPGALGARWADAADILPAACLGLMIVGPVSVSVAGYLYAQGDAATPLRGAILHTTAQYAVAFPLLPALRGWALGLAGLAAGVVEAVVLGRAAARHSRARIMGPLLVPLLAACLAGGGGWALAVSGHPTLWLAAASAVGAAAAYLAMVGALRPALVGDTVGLVRRAVSRA
jgi:O-antigen/teichoic acid export membrane protein